MLFSRRNKRRLIDLIFLIFPIVTAGLIILLVDRGIDITDEGFLLLGYKHPEEVISALTYLPVILGKLTAPFNPTPSFFRLLKLIAISISSTLFAHKMAKLLEISFSRIAIICTVLMTSYLNYSLDHRTISYNTIVLIVALWAVSTLPISNNGDKPTRWLGVGTAIGFLFWIKFPSSITILIFITLISAFFKFKHLSFLYIGWAVGFCIYFIFRSPIESITNLANAISAASQGFHNPLKLLVAYLKMSFELIKLSLKIPFIMLIILACALTFKKIKNRNLFINLFISGGTIYACIQGMMLKTPVITLVDLIFFTTFLLLILVIQENKKSISLQKETAIIMFSLAIAPYICIIGTNVGLGISLGYFLCFWGVLYIYLTDLLIKKASLKNMNILATPLFLTLCAFSAYIIYEGAIQHPYNDNRHSLWDYTEKSSIKDLNKVKLDKETISFLEDLYKLLHNNTNFKAGDPILALYNMPGLVYLLDGTSPGTPWYFIKKHEHKRNCTAIKASKMTNLDRTIILQNVPVVPPQMVHCMKKAGIIYPENYIFYKKLFVNPFTLSKFLKGKTFLLISIPKSLKTNSYSNNGNKN